MEWLVLYTAVMGELPGFGDVGFIAFIGDSAENGVKNFFRNLVSKIDRSDLLRQMLKIQRKTDAEMELVNTAYKLQTFLQTDSRAGTRYTELIQAHFGVVSPDARLQRPEYLGGGSASININPVAQTSSTDATSPQANLAAYGTQIARKIGFQKAFTEHGYIIGLAAAGADLSYQQGINKMWNRRTRFDFYWPTLS